MSYLDHENLIKEPNNSNRLPRFSFEAECRPHLANFGFLEGPWIEERRMNSAGMPLIISSQQCTIPRKQLDEIVITWKEGKDPRNPLQWSLRKKWVTTILVSLFTFVSPFSTTMVTPALPTIGADLHIPEGFMQQLVMSIFLLGYALGPFILGPLSEVYGRTKVLQCSNFFYLIFNTACGFSRTKTQLLALRFLAGMGGSAPQAISNGFLADIWTKEARGLGQSIYGYATWMGPCLAPIWGAIMAKKANWHWIFYSVSIFDASLLVISLFFLNETYAPAILAREAAKVRKLIPDSGQDHTVVRTEYDTRDKWSKMLQKRIRLPFIMLFTHPAMQIPSLFRSYLYGTLYLVLSTFPMVYETAYNQEALIASLHYLALMLGFLIGLEISHRAIDKLYIHLKKMRNVTDGPPEWRLPPMLIGGFLAPIGLLVYGWTAFHHTHWIAPDFGAAILGAGLIIAFQCTQAYTTDTYGSKYGASAAATSAFMRTMCGFGFPLFAPKMYESMGVGRGNSMLAGLSFLLLLGSTGGLWLWGEKLRSWSWRGLEGADKKYGIGCGGKEVEAPGV